MKTSGYAQKIERATQQHEVVEKSEAGHPKSWDRYIEKRQKQHKEQTRASQKRK